MSNLLEVREDGVTVVETKTKKDIVLVSVAMFNVMRNIPELEDLVIHLMAGRVTPDDLGIETRVNVIPKGVDPEKFLRKVKGQEPAKVDDVPDFVKRSLDKLKEDK